MPLLFWYKDALDKWLKDKQHLSDGIELKGWRNEKTERYETIVQDTAAVVIGSLIELSEDELKECDKEYPESDRISVQIGPSAAFAYVVKPEYMREERFEVNDMTEEEKKDFLKLAMERFQECKTQNDHIKEEYEEDLKFKFGDQWRTDTAQDRQNDSRPALTVNECNNFTNLVVNEGLQNRPAIKVRPNDDLTDPMTADVVAGLIRHIINQNRSKMALDHAFKCAVNGGIGYFRAITDYADDTSFDQEIILDKIDNPCAVTIPDHIIKKSDYADMPYCFIRQKYSKAEFEERWPDAIIQGASFPGNQYGDANWVDKDTIWVAEYFTVEEAKQTIYLLPSDENHKAAYISDKIPEGVEPLREREVFKKVVHWYLMTAWEVLDSGIFPTSRIPIFPLFGEEILQNGKKHYISLIRNMKEIQRMLNFFWSAFTEAITNAPKAPFLVDYRSIKGAHKKYWDEMNKKNWPYLPYASEVGGKQLPPPQRLAPPEVGQSITQGIQYCLEFLKDTSGIQNANLGQMSNERTGKAIEARARQGNLATYHFMNSYMNSMLALGNFLLELIPIIYDTPRTIRIVGEDQADKVVKVNMIHEDPEDPQRLYDLKTGKYSIICTIGPSYDTRRMETADMLSNLMQTAPQLTMIFFDILARVMDMPGGQEIAARAKRFISQQYPGVITDDELGTPEDQLRAQVQAMTADIQKLAMKSQMDEQEKQQLYQTLDRANKALQDKQLETSAKVQIQGMKSQSEAQKAMIGLLQERIKQHTANVHHAVDTALEISGLSASENQKNASQPAGNAEPE